MSDKIKKAYEDNPAAGNDPSQEGYVAVGVGGTVAIGHSYTQVASIVANRLGISENLPDQATFSARFPDNSLIATVDQIQTAYEYYVINTTGTTPTSGGTTGALAFTAADFENSYPYYLYISDDDSTYAQLEPSENDVNNDGLDPPGLVLKAKDTISPTTTTTAWTLATGTEPTTDISVTLPVFSDAGSGVDQVDLWNWDITGAYTLYRSDISNSGAAQNLSGNSPGQVLDLVPIAVDNSGNTTELAHQKVTLDSGSNGEVNFSGYTVEGNNKIVEGDEDTLSVNITLEWTGTGTNPAFDVDVSTVEYADNASDGVEFTAISGVTKSFGAAETDNKITFTITLIDTNAIENNMFGIILDTESATNSVVIGAVNGINVRILGSGAAAGTGYEQDNTADELLVIDCEHMTTVPENGDAFNALSQTRALTELSIKSSLASDQGNATTIGDGSATVSGSSCPYRTVDVVWRSSVVQYFWLRFWANTNTSANRVHIALDDDATGNTALLNAAVTLSGVSDFQWIGVDEVGNQLATSGAVTAGSDTIQLAPYKTGTQVDRLCATSNTNYDPNVSGALDSDLNDKGNSGDDYYGPVESTIVVEGSAEDNEANPTIPPVPPVGGTAVTLTYSPVDGFTTAPVSATPTLSYPLGSEISSTSFVVTANSVDVQGAISTNVTGNAVTFTPVTPFDNSLSAQEIVIVAKGTVRDENGDIKDYDSTGWNFTIPLTGDFIWEENFNNLAVGTLWSTVATSRIAAQGLSLNTVASIGSETKIFSDPLGDSARGNVLGVYQEAGTTAAPAGLGLCEMQVDLKSHGSETIYFAYDAMFKAINPITGNPTEIMILTKMPGLAGASPINNVGAAAGGNQPDGIIPSAFSARCQRMRFGDSSRLTGQWGYVGYLYSSTFNQSVAQALDETGNKWELTSDTWHEIEVRVTRNTGSNSDGIFELWTNGVKRVERTNIKWKVDDIPINLVFFATGYGGDPSSSLFYPSEPQMTFYDNLRVSTDSITH